MVSLTYTSTARRKNSGGYNGGEMHSNPKEDSSKDRYIGQGPLATGKAKRVVDPKAEGSGCSKHPFLTWRSR